MMIRLREEKAEQARSLILSPELSPGSYGVGANTMKQLRGLCVRRLTWNLFWRCLSHPIDLLLAHVSESGITVSFGEVEIWLSMFNALISTRSLAQSDKEWEFPPHCSLELLQVMRQRLSGAMRNPNAIWMSGDATLTRMAGIKWEIREYFQLSPGEVIRDFHRGEWK